MRLRHIILASIILSIVLVLAVSCSRTKPATYQKSRALMDTFVTITVVAGSEKEADASIESAFARLERFGNLINFFSEESELSRVNKNAGATPTTVSPETLYLIEKALYVAEKSDGAFDPTIGPVMTLWDFHNNKKPADEELRNKVRLVNYRDVKIDHDKSTVFLKRKGMMLDLGGIAKGYAAELAADTLKEQGIKSGIVAVAGDIKTFGLRPDGMPWNIGIKNPRQTGADDEIIATVRLSGKAISTAGDYERFFIIDGQRYHHILDPVTGHPVMGTRSVSVVTEKGVFADGFDNAIFVLGPERGMKLVQEINKDFPMDAIIIDGSGGIQSTPGLEGILQIEKTH